MSYFPPLVGQACSSQILRRHCCLPLVLLYLLCDAMSEGFGWQMAFMNNFITLRPANKKPNAPALLKGPQSVSNKMSINVRLNQAGTTWRESSQADFIPKNPQIAYLEIFRTLSTKNAVNWGKKGILSFLQQGWHNLACFLRSSSDQEWFQISCLPQLTILLEPDWGLRTEDSRPKTEDRGSKDWKLRLRAEDWGPWG